MEKQFNIVGGKHWDDKRCLGCEQQDRCMRQYHCNAEGIKIITGEKIFINPNQVIALVENPSDDKNVTRVYMREGLFVCVIGSLEKVSSVLFGKEADENGNMRFR